MLVVTSCLVEESKAKVFHGHLIYAFWESAEVETLLTEVQLFIVSPSLVL